MSDVEATKRPAEQAIRPAVAYILREFWMGGASGYPLRETAREPELAGNRGGANTASATFEKVEVAIQ